MPSSLQGHLRVDLLRAEGLPDVEWAGQDQDPYCELSVGKSRTQKSFTHKDGGKNPVWRQVFEFEHVLSGQDLRVKIADRNRLLMNKPIGTCSLLITEAMANGQLQQHKLPVRSHKTGELEGCLYLTTVYTPEDASGKPITVQKPTACLGSASMPTAAAAPSPAKLEGLMPHSQSANDPFAKQTQHRWILSPPFINRDRNSQYHDWQSIGQGRYGVTYRALHWKTEKQYAIKVISKSQLTTREARAEVAREVQMLQAMDGHPHVVQLHDAWETHDEVCLVEELCAGGKAGATQQQLLQHRGGSARRRPCAGAELVDAIAQWGHYSERDAAAIMRTIIRTVADMHSRGIMHRDLRTDNWLFTSSSKNATLKLTGFRSATRFTPGVPLHDPAGSLLYAAPEVLEGDYGPQADIWSCGCILYALLCGKTPYQGTTPDELLFIMKHKPLDVNTPPWPTISAQAKDCVRRLLDPDPARRARPEDILHHDWLREGGCAGDAPLQAQQGLKGLKKLSGMNSLTRLAVKLVAQCLPAQEKIALLELFESIDVDCSDSISMEEFVAAMAKQGQNLRYTDVMDMMQAADANGDNQLDFKEFVAVYVAVMLSEQSLPTESLQLAFSYFDRNGDGSIDRSELLKVLTEHKVRPEDIPASLQAADANGDGQISFAEFCQMLRGP